MWNPLKHLEDLRERVLTLEKIVALMGGRLAELEVKPDAPTATVSATQRVRRSVKADTQKQ